MTKNLMLAIVALLGFSTACSSVKKSPQKSDSGKDEADTTVICNTNAPDTIRRVVVMYGVPVYKLDSSAMQRVHQGIGADELTPITETPHDEQDPQLDKPSSQASQPVE